MHFISDEGLHFRPFVYGLKGQRHPESLRYVYEEDTSRIYPVRLFARGSTYELWGLFETDVHLFGVEEGGGEPQKLVVPPAPECPPERKAQVEAAINAYVASAGAQ